MSLLSDSQETRELSASTWREWHFGLGSCWNCGETWPWCNKMENWRSSYGPGWRLVHWVPSFIIYIILNFYSYRFVAVFSITYIDNFCSIIFLLQYQYCQHIISCWHLTVGGGNAEFVAVHENHLLPVNELLSLKEAAAIPEVWLTAFQLLHFVG